ncbi:MAG: hypothetical protein JNK47_17245 [Mesorhizobium sp.]|nr:hypothetical protein [Mesorhizobium sp.]MBL8578967.1 hypothetical protein [Mesorhizobium sp.]
MNRPAILTVALIAMVSLSIAATAADDPRTVGEAFCKARGANDDAATRSLLTPSLIAEVDAAQARSDVIGKTNPDEKPPLGDGIPYQAFPDVPKDCVVGAVADGAGSIEVKVTYSFPDSPDANWTDRLKLVTENDSLSIDDVIYANVANGEPDLSLRQILMDAFDQ